MNYFANNSKFLRQKKGLSHAEIAAAIGISRTTWIGYESGLSQPNLSGLLKIVEFLDISATDLLEKDLSNVHLILKSDARKNMENVHLNVHPNVFSSIVSEPEVPYGIQKSTQTECLNCQNNAKVIAKNEALIDSLHTNIAFYKKEVHTLNLTIDNMLKSKAQQSTEPKKKVG